MTTKLLYLEDFDAISCEAKVVGINEIEDGRTDMVLDQTCFYPRGGGQDWDVGSIQNPDGIFRVEEVRLDEQGSVHHIGSFTSGRLKAGETVECKADAKTRGINTRLHSAGHVIDMAMSALKPSWVPVRGGHYPHMSFVEYQVPEDDQIDDGFVGMTQAKVTELLKSPFQNQLLFMPKEEMGRYCRHVPDNLPTNKPSRIVLYAEDFGIPCGGTHVKNVQQIGEVTITKAKLKKGLAKVSYAVSGIN